MQSPSPPAPRTMRIALHYRGVPIATLTQPMIESLQAVPDTGLRFAYDEASEWVDLATDTLNKSLEILHSILLAAQLAPSPGVEHVDVLHPLTQERLGRVDRHLARLLGMEMHSAHMLVVSDRGLCLQRRSLSKTVDPGLWDTTVGGTRVAGESIDQTLVREMWEEAGLSTEQLTDVRLLGMWSFDRESTYGIYPAWQQEKIWVWAARVAQAHWEPRCSDGEVMEFAWQPFCVLQSNAAVPLTHELRVLLDGPELTQYLARMDSL